MQFCSYSLLFTPYDVILKAYIVLLLCIPSALILGLLAEEKHIAKIIRSLSPSMKAVIDRLHPIGMVLLSVIVVNLLIPRYGILTIKYIDPDTPMTITQSEIVDELCQFIEQDSFGYDFDIQQPYKAADKRHKTLILTKDEWLKIKASEDKIEKAAKDAREQENRGNLEIIK
jgi:hypothetical protein